MFNRKQKGFTLIELLVVIAIIGLLAGIVLVSLGGARNSAKDARITAVISQTRSLAELVSNSNNGKYELAVADATKDLCAPAGVTGTLSETHTIYGPDFTAIEAEVVAQKAGNAASCQASPTAFCVYAQLNTGQYYCIDSTARAGITTNPGVDGKCLEDVTPTYVCP